MAKTNLTDRGLKALRPGPQAYDVHDSIVPGMSVRVMPSGVKTFILIGRFGEGRRPTRRALGKYGAMTLEQARVLAREWIAMKAAGVDPKEARAQERANRNKQKAATFAVAAEAFLQTQVIGRDPAQPILRTAPRLIGQTRAIMVPIFGARPLVGLTAAEIMQACDRIRELGTDRALVAIGARKELRRPTLAGGPAPEEARDIFMLMDRILRWAADCGRFDGFDLSPLARIRKAAAFGPRHKRRRSFSEAELAAVWRGAETMREPWPQIYKLLMLTGLRLREVTDATWAEFDRKKKLWKIPAGRMKGRNSSAREHDVPLTDRMLAVLKEVEVGPRGPFVFSVSLGVRPVQDHGGAKAILDREVARQCGEALPPFVNHDIRRTVRSFLPKLGVDRETAEMILAHQLPGLDAVYDHHPRLDERRAALTKWGDYLANLVAPNVVSIKSRVA